MEKSFVRNLTVVSIILCLAMEACCSDIRVATPVTKTTINTAIESASPGDTIIVPDGTFNNIGALSANVDGRPKSKIVFKAKTPGKVTFTGSFGFTNHGNHWIVRDFVFKDIYSSKATFKVIHLVNSNHTRVTNNQFINITSAKNISSCIRLKNGSSDCEIDHNYFKGVRGANIANLTGSYRTYIHHNHFKNIPSHSKHTAIHNGGDSRHATRQNLKVLVEYNLFDNCRGDAETISNKSSGNTYRYNVFKNGKALVLRGGNNCVVESNYFYGNNDFGVRFYGSGHIIRNNYFDGLNYWVIRIPGGAAHYQDTYNCVIANNTSVNSKKDGIYFGDNSIPPHDLVFKNNIIIAGKGRCIRNTASSNITWENNLLYATGSGACWDGPDEPDSGITKANPNLTQGTYILRLPSSGSPALDAGTVVDGVTDDIDGHTRDASTPDIGCDEYSDNAPVRIPVKEKDVGVSWMTSANEVNLKAL